jgi:hypothetical protein
MILTSNREDTKTQSFEIDLWKGMKAVDVRQMVTNNFRLVLQSILY